MSKRYHHESSWLEFLWGSLLVPAVFFIAFRSYGAKPAIAFAVVASLLQAGLLRWRGLPLSPFFLVGAGFTVIFGLLDLALTSPRFFRLEPFLQNVLLGTVFATTMVARHPLALWFAEALPERVRPELGSPESRAYLRRVTGAWVVYFYVKGLLYLWAAKKMDLAELVAFRSAVGGGSLALMFVGEVLYRKLRLNRKTARLRTTGRA